MADFCTTLPLCLFCSLIFVTRSPTHCADHLNDGVDELRVLRAEASKYSLTWADGERSWPRFQLTRSYIRHQIQASVSCLSAVLVSVGLPCRWLRSHQINQLFNKGKSACTCLRCTVQSPSHYIHVCNRK